MYMYIYAYVYAYIYIYICIYLRIYLYTNIHIYLCIHTHIYIYIGMHWAKTARQEQAAITPPPYNYGAEAPKMLLVFTVGPVYSVLNPLVLPFVTIYFGIGYVVVKYKVYACM